MNITKKKENFVKKQTADTGLKNLMIKNAAKEVKNTTLEDIGNIFKVTRMRICQIEKKAIKKIKSIILKK